jgi:ER lumen protein retaining receptor
MSRYLEAVAMLPQIFMFQKQSGDQGGIVDALIGHTVFALGFSRVFELVFWLGSFRELSDHAGSRLPGYIVLLSQLAHLVIMGDFFYYYFTSISKGMPMKLPVTSYSSNSV